MNEHLITEICEECNYYKICEEAGKFDCRFKNDIQEIIDKNEQLKSEKKRLKNITLRILKEIEDTDKDFILLLEKNKIIINDDRVKKKDIYNIFNTEKKRYDYYKQKIESMGGL